MRIINGLSEDGETHSIKRFRGDLNIPKINNFDVSLNSLLVMFCDTETTGLDSSDEIIDLGYIIFEMDKLSGKIISTRQTYSELNEPENKVISKEITNLTGISPEMVVGKKIDWDEVQEDFDRVQLVIAHNARFDRGMLLKYLPVHEKFWMCSLFQIPWREMGHFSSKQESLARDHGFFYEGHRALIDCQAALKILSGEGWEDKSYLSYAQKDLKIKYKIIIAKNSQFHFKDALKEKGFRWYQNGNKKFWYCPNIAEDSEKEFEIKSFMEENEKAGAGTIQEVNISAKLRFASTDEIFESIP